MSNYLSSWKKGEPKSNEKSQKSFGNMPTASQDELAGIIAEVQYNENRRIITKDALYGDPADFCEELGLPKSKAVPSFDWAKHSHWILGTGNAPALPKNVKIKKSELQKKIDKAVEKPVTMSKAESMMLKMGWQGGGLGKTGEGIMEPITPNANYALKTVGFGVQGPKKNKCKLPRSKRAKNVAYREMKQAFRLNILLHIYEFLKDDSEVAICFDPKLSKHERKCIHLVVQEVMAGELPPDRPVVEMSLAKEIKDFNRFELKTLSEGKHPNRFLCLSKEAAENMYLIIPENLRPEEEEDDLEINPDGTATVRKKLNKQDQNKDIEKGKWKGKGKWRSKGKGKGKGKYKLRSDNDYDDSISHDQNSDDGIVDTETIDLEDDTYYDVNGYNIVPSIDQTAFDPTAKAEGKPNCDEKVTNGHRIESIVKIIDDDEVITNNDTFKDPNEIAENNNVEVINELIGLSETTAENKPPHVVNFLKFLENSAKENVDTPISANKKENLDMDIQIIDAKDTPTEKIDQITKNNPKIQPQQEIDVQKLSVQNDNETSNVDIQMTEAKVEPGTEKKEPLTREINTKILAKEPEIDIRKLLVVYLKEFAEDDTYDELRFLGSFYVEEVLAISEFWEKVDDCLDDRETERDEVYEILKGGQFELKPDFSGSTVLYKLREVTE